MTSLHLDFETRSACDLKVTGLYVYAKHPTTDVHCMAYAFDDEPVQIWKRGEPIPERVEMHITLGGQLTAHNAQFERAIFAHVMGPRYGWPVPETEQWRCTMVMAYAMALPGALEHMGPALNTGFDKDMTGNRLMLAMSRPRNPRKGEPTDVLLWRDSPEDLERLYSYCKSDVEAERAGDKRLVRLRPSEQALWHLDQRINDRGVPVDPDLARRNLRIVEAHTAKLDREMARVTDYEVSACSNVNQLKTFLKSKGVTLNEKLNKATMQFTETLDKESVTQILLDPNLHPAARRALELRQEGGKASVDKIGALLNGMDADGRARGLTQFHAANTGRWGGRRFQPQNILRPDEDFDVDGAIDVILKYPTAQAMDILDAMFGTPITCVSYTLRGMIKAPKRKKIVAADFSNIEGVVLAWLAGEQPRLQAFREYFAGKGPDLYCVAASGIYGIPNITKKTHPTERQVGKVAELACFGPRTQVLTHRGYKVITAVLADDLLWDGVEWVKHEGLLDRGVRRVVDVAGIEVTPDHLIATGRTWTPAQQLASSESILHRALETGSANLPWPQRCAETSFWSDANAGQSRTKSIGPTFGKAVPLRAIAALKRKALAGSRTIGDTLTSWLTTAIVVGFSTECQLASTVATTRTTRTTPTTAVAGFRYTGHGERTVVPSCRISSRLTDGIIRRLNSIARKWTATTPRGIFVSLRGARTLSTSERLGTSNDVSPIWKPVYDIANAGPRHRFTILSDRGPLLVHNCGYGGGVGAFQTMAATQGVHVPDSQAEEIKTAWRNSNPSIVQFWQDLDDAAIAAIRSPGRQVSAGPITYKVVGSFLWCRLPSGRALCYPYPKALPVKTPWGEMKDAVTFKTVPNVSNRKKTVWEDSTNTSKWARISTYGGALCENVTQAVARDLLAEAMVRLEREGYPVILTVHDESVSEVDEGFGSASEYEQIMCELPAWASGLPISASGFESGRYRK